MDTIKHNPEIEGIYYKWKNIVPPHIPVENYTVQDFNNQEPVPESDTVRISKKAKEMKVREGIATPPNLPPGYTHQPRKLLETDWKPKKRESVVLKQFNYGGNNE